MSLDVLGGRVPARSRRVGLSRVNTYGVGIDPGLLAIDAFDGRDVRRGVDVAC